MGLFWSMVPDPSGPRNMRMVVKNVERPVLYTLSVFLGHLTLHDLCTDSGSSLHPLSSATVERVVIGEGVQRIPVKEGTVRGMFFLPPGWSILFLCPSVCVCLRITLCVCVRLIIASVCV